MPDVKSTTPENRYRSSRRRHRRGPRRSHGTGRPRRRPRRPASRPRRAVERVPDADPGEAVGLQFGPVDHPSGSARSSNSRSSSRSGRSRRRRRRGLRRPRPPGPVACDGHVDLGPQLAAAPRRATRTRGRVRARRPTATLEPHSGGPDDEQARREVVRQLVGHRTDPEEAGHPVMPLFPTTNRSYPPFCAVSMSAETGSASTTSGVDRDAGGLWAALAASTTALSLRRFGRRHDGERAPGGGRDVTPRGPRPWPPS